MEVNCETIKHLASLSNFSLDPEEEQALTANLQDIIQYISDIEKLPTDDVEPTYQVFEMENVWRDDEIKEQDCTREELLALTEASEEHQIKVPKVL